MSRFDNPRNTAPSLEALQNQFLKVPRSTHDFSCTKHFNAWCGVLMPIDHIDTLPNEDYNLNYDIVIESISALQKNLKTGFTLFVHALYMRDSQLWEGAENFYTRGRTGNIGLVKPCIAFRHGNGTQNGCDSNSVLSLADFLDYPVPYYYNGSDSSNISPTLSQLLTLSTPKRSVPNRSSLADRVCFSALPFVMYQRVYTEIYMNQNLLINNKKVLPENVHHMILPYSAGNESGNLYHYALYLDYDTPFIQNVSSRIQYDYSPDGDFYVPSAENQKPLALSALRYRQKKGDYFTTALPFEDLVRGTIPSLSLEDLGGSASINFNDVVKTDPEGSGDHYGFIGINNFTPDGIKIYSGHSYEASSSSTKQNFIYPNDSSSQGLLEALNKAKVNFSMSLTLSNLRALEAYTIFAERMARTSGKYNDMIKAQFGYNPHAKDYMPIYIGGFYQNIDISSVTQTSPDTSSGNSTGGVGSMTAKAIAAGRNNIGHFHSPDYGHIMVIASIVPEIVYSNQGVPRLSSSVEQSQTYFPLLENLSPQVILNRELYTGNNSLDILNAGFGWTELFSEYKSRQNKAYGMIGASDGTIMQDSGAYVSKFLFSSVPTLSNEFMTLSPKNIPNNIWQSPDDVPFIMTVSCNVRKTTCMSYITQPGGLSSRLG